MMQWSGLYHRGIFPALFYLLLKQAQLARDHARQDAGTLMYS